MHTALVQPNSGESSLSLVKPQDHMEFSGKGDESIQS